MINQSNIFSLMSSIALCLSLSGCSGTVDDQPDIGLVKGVVTLDGQPLSGASISFLPDSGRTALGTTDANGYYELNYIRDTMGCKIGHNKVVITTLTDNIEDDSAFEGDDVDTKKIKPVKEMLPAIYNKKTKLEAIVEPGANQFDFNLTKSKK